MFIFQIIILLYIIFCIYHIIEIQKYNKNGLIIDYSDENYILKNSSIKESYNLLNPVLLKIKNDNINLNNLIELNKSYLLESDKYIITLNKIQEIDSIQIFKNFKICEDLKINIDFNLDFLEDMLLFNHKYSLSIFKNYQITDMIFCRNNINIIYILMENLLFIYLIQT